MTSVICQICYPDDQWCREPFNISEDLYVTFSNTKYEHKISLPPSQWFGRKSPRHSRSNSINLKKIKKWKGKITMTIFICVIDFTKFALLIRLRSECKYIFLTTLFHDNFFILIVYLFFLSCLISTIIWVIIFETTINLYRKYVLTWKLKQ